MALTLQLRCPPVRATLNRYGAWFALRIAGQPDVDSAAPGHFTGPFYRAAVLNCGSIFCASMGSIECWVVGC